MVDVLVMTWAFTVRLGLSRAPTKRVFIAVRLHPAHRRREGQRGLNLLVHFCCLRQVSDSFPFKWINKKWKEGFYVTSMATSHTRWAVVMSRNAGFVDQCVELDFQYPSEGIHRRWDAGEPPHALSTVAAEPVLRLPNCRLRSRNNTSISVALQCIPVKMLLC